MFLSFMESNNLLSQVLCLNDRKECMQTNIALDIHPFQQKIYRNEDVALPC